MGVADEKEGEDEVLELSFDEPDVDVLFVV